MIFPLEEHLHHKHIFIACERGLSASATEEPVPQVIQFIVSFMRQFLDANVDIFTKIIAESLCLLCWNCKRQSKASCLRPLFVE